MDFIVASCLEEEGHLQEAYNQFQGSGRTIISIPCNTQNETESALKKGSKKQR